MAHDPTNNPTVTGGRKTRFVIGGVANRKFRADHTAERNLKTLGEFLNGKTVEDRPSISSLLRRAVAVYTEHVKALAGDHSQLTREKMLVRQGSKLPKVKQKDAPCQEQPAGNA